MKNGEKIIMNKNYQKKKIGTNFNVLTAEQAEEIASFILGEKNLSEQ